MNYTRLAFWIGNICLAIQLCYWVQGFVTITERLRLDLAGNIAEAFAPGYVSASARKDSVAIVCSMGAVALEFDGLSLDSLWEPTIRKNQWE